MAYELATDGIFQRQMRNAISTLAMTSGRAKHTIHAANRRVICLLIAMMCIVATGCARTVGPSCPLTFWL